MQMNSFSPFGLTSALLSFLCVVAMGTYDATAQPCSAGFIFQDESGGDIHTVNGVETDDLILCHTESNALVLNFVSISQVSGGAQLTFGGWELAGDLVPGLGNTQFQLPPERTLEVSVLIEDDQGCSDMASVTIRLVGQPSFVPVTVQPTCFGGCDGSLTATYDTDNEDLYTHIWSFQGFPQGGGDIIESACAGSWSVEVTDPVGCTDFDLPFTLSQPAAIEVGISPAGPLVVCPGDGPQPLEASVLFAALPLQTIAWSWPDGLSQPGQLVTDFTPTSNNVNQTLDINITDANGCAGSASIHIVAESAGVFGSAMVNGEPCDGCVIEVFKYGETGVWTPYAANSSDLEGTFELALMFGLTDHLLRIKVPEDIHPDMPKLYYPATHDWMQAAIVTTGCGDMMQKDFNITTPPQMNGNATVTGGVYYQYSGKMQAEDPIPHIDVVVEKVPPGNGLSVVTTGLDGQFTFNFVPESLGDTIYRFYVDMPGVPMASTHILSIGADDVFFEYMDFCLNEDSTEINTCSVLSVTELGSSEEVLLTVFPNPAADVVRFRVQGSGAGITEVLLIDLTGRTAHSSQPETADFELNLNGLSAGLYTAIVQLSDGTVLSERLMVGR